MRQLYPACSATYAFFHVLVCSADAKDVPAKNGKPLLVKTGVHLHWPHITMSPGQALTLHVEVLDSLGECFGQHEEPANDWATALDTSVHPTLLPHFLWHQALEAAGTGTGAIALQGSGHVQGGRRRARGRAYRRSQDVWEAPALLCSAVGRAGIGMHTKRMYCARESAACTTAPREAASNAQSQGLRGAAAQQEQGIFSSVTCSGCASMCPLSSAGCPSQAHPGPRQWPHPQ